MEQFYVTPIGEMIVTPKEAKIVLKQEFAPALQGLSGFRHLNLIWWFSGCDDTKSRSTLQEPCPYQGGPEMLGTFATRSPQRPNPIALSCVEVTYIDMEAATIGITYTDADHGSPVLDLKPYTPSLDRVQAPRTPDWCAHWPGSLEESGDFDWSTVFRL